MEWIFCGTEILTGEVMALEPEDGLPFREGVVTASLLLVLPTLPEGDGVGDMGDGVPVILQETKHKAIETLPFSKPYMALTLLVEH